MARIKLDNEFMECESCRSKPGSPTLCEACLHNRDLVESLLKDKDSLNSQIEQYMICKYLKPDIALAVSFDGGNNFQKVETNNPMAKIKSLREKHKTCLFRLLKVYAEVMDI